MSTQLRRYVLREGVWDAFLPWFRETLIPVRERFGFRLEFAYRIEESNEFVWAVSLEGDDARFDAVEREYLDSDERAAAWVGIGAWTAEQDLRLVEVIA